jgi:hypothetical protein
VDPDPGIHASDPDADPDPAIFVIDLQDANKKLIKKNTFEGIFTSFSKDKK